MVNDRVHKYFLNWLRLSSTEPQPSPVQSLQQLKSSLWKTSLKITTGKKPREWYKVTWNKSESTDNVIALVRTNECARIVKYQPIIGIVANGLNKSQTNFIDGTCSYFRGVFMAGAPEFLTGNIHPKRGLSNGTPVTFHSLLRDSRENLNRVLVGIIHARKWYSNTIRLTS